MPYDIIIGRTEEDKEKFKKKGLIFLGRSYVKMGQTTSLANNLFLDVVRPHVIMISGKRGSGKCLTGDSLITLDNGSILPIRELENNQNKVFGLNEKLKIKETKKTEFFKRNVKKIIKIKLRSGKEIKLTPEHPLLTIKGWKEAKELNLKSRIATARKINCFGKEKLEEFKIKLLAYLIAEGHTRKSWVLFSNYNKKIIKEFKECVKKFNKELQVSLHSKSGCYRVTNKNNRYGFKKNSMKGWLQSLNIYNQYAKEKWIPECIFRLEKKSLALFLNRLFSCDGSIYKNEFGNGWEVDYSSSSKILIKQVQHLLLRFGILSKIRNKQIKYKNKFIESFEIIINPENSLKFIKEIGFFSDKEEKARRCYKEIKNIARNPNVDTIPKEIWELYKPNNWAKIGRAMEYTCPKAIRERMRYCPSRQILLQVARTDNSTPIELLAKSDIFWDEIVSMEILEGDFEVYDICVPKFHNFIANDIIVHNSYSASVLAEEISTLPQEIKKNISVLFFDTLGVFWTMKFPNTRQEKLLQRWNLKPEKIDITIYTPQGHFEDYRKRGLPTDYSFTIKTSELNTNDWSDIFKTEIISPLGILIEKVITRLKEKNQDYSIKDIINEIQKEKTTDKKIKEAVESRFLATEKWGLFSKEGTKIGELVKPGKVSVLDISAYTESKEIKSLVIALFSRKLLEQRIKARKFEEIENIKTETKYFEESKKIEKPLVWIMLDEAHEFLPKDGKSLSSEALVQLLREGRQPGISLVLVTQQPGEIHKDVLTQSDIILSHRLTAKKDITALNSMMQSYLIKDLQDYINDLPKTKGSAIILDDNSERIYPIQVHPKKSWHGGEAPSAIKTSKKEWEELYNE